MFRPRGYAVAQLVETLRYKPEGRGFDSNGDIIINSFCRTIALGLTEPLTKMRTRNISWGLRRRVRRADNLTTMCRLS